MRWPFLHAPFPLLFPCFGFVVAVLLAVLIAKDAQQRGMNGVLWGVGVFLLCIVFLPLYLIMRNPLPRPAAQPGPASPATYSPGPAPGGSMKYCGGCGNALPPGMRFCNRCGKEQPV